MPFATQFLFSGPQLCAEFDSSLVSVCAQDTIFIDKPIRLVGQPGKDLWGRTRKGVVIQSDRSVVFLCNARYVSERSVHFENYCRCVRLTNVSQLSVAGLET